MESVYQTILYKEYTYVEPNVNEIDNIISKTLTDCRDKYKCIYDNSFTNIRKNKKVDIKNEKRCLKEIKKTIFAGHKSFKFIQIDKITILFWGGLSDINIH